MNIVPRIQPGAKRAQAFRKWSSRDSLHHIVLGPKLITTVPSDYELNMALPVVENRRSMSLMPLEILYVTFMFFSRGARLEGTEISSLARFRIYLAGI
jgi:hypothetical protein